MMKSEFSQSPHSFFIAEKWFEAGADAILEAVRKQPMTKPNGYLYGRLKGKWVFIPDDEGDADA